MPIKKLLLEFPWIFFAVWIVKDNDPSRYRQWESTFLSLQPIDGKVDGKIAKRPLEESGLDKDHLKK